MNTPLRILASRGTATMRGTANRRRMGASIGSIATARAQYDLRKMFVFLNVFPINQPEVMIGNAAERFDAEGNLTDETTKQFTRQLLEHLVEWTRRIQPHEAAQER